MRAIVETADRTLGDVLTELLAGGDESAAAGVIVVDEARLDESMPATLPVLVVRSSASGRSAQDLLLAGAAGVVDDCCTGAQLRMAVGQVVEYGAHLSAYVAALVLPEWRAMRLAGSSTLDGRQQQVLAAVVAGRTVRQTASSLGVSVATVERDRSAVFAQLGVSGAVAAVARARQLGLVSHNLEDRE